jgi:hypothetical protein
MALSLVSVRHQSQFGPIMPCLDQTDQGFLRLNQALCPLKLTFNSDALHPYLKKPQYRES